MKRIGMLTSGGDCQALNAAMRGVAKAMLNANEKVEIYGFQDGYQGLIYGRAAPSLAPAAPPSRPSRSRGPTAWTRWRP